MLTGHLRRRSPGFTLIEMALVLTIAGLIVTSLVSLFVTQVANNQISSTRGREDAIKTALITFISRNNRLPCPAVPTLLPTDPNYGKESPTPATCTGTAVGGFPVAIGIVPWIDLGLSNDAGQDAYNQRFTYAVSLLATNLNRDTVAGMAGVINMYKTTPATVANQINANNLAAVAIISHGKNGFGAYLPSGSRAPLPTGANEQENTNADVNFVQADYSENATNPFDDIVAWLTPADLLSPLAKDGAIPSARSVTNDRYTLVRNALVDYISQQPGKAIPPAQGGAGVPVTVLVIPVIYASDGWNQPFSYVRNLPAACTNTPGSAFTITSAGPNGVPGDADDIPYPQLNSDLNTRIAQKTGMPCP